MKGWSIWKKLVVFPLVPLVFVLAVCTWIVISDTTGQPRMIDGHPDDAPRMAALFLGFIALVLYAVYLVGLGIAKVISNTGHDAKRRPEEGD